MGKSISKFVLMIVLITSIGFLAAATIKNDLDNKLSEWVAPKSADDIKNSLAGNAKAALAVKGVKTANWDIKTHFLTVNLKARTDLEDVYQAVAKAGHNNIKYQIADKTYNTLPTCCQHRKE